MTAETLAPRRTAGIRLTEIVRSGLGTDGSTGMGEALLSRLPELDAVLLAYHSADRDGPGCYVAQRSSGSSVPCSAARPGPGAAFAALRVADGMCRLGELNRGALFVYGRRTTARDMAVVLRLGTTGGVAVHELAEVTVPGPGARTPTLALANVLYRYPGVRVLAGTGLAPRLVGTPYADRVETVPGPWCTGVWTGLAHLWPLTERVLLADYQPAGGTFHSCVVVPRKR